MYPKYWIGIINTYTCALYRVVTKTIYASKYIILSLYISQIINRCNNWSIITTLISNIHSNQVSSHTIQQRPSKMNSSHLTHTSADIPAPTHPHLYSNSHTAKEYCLCYYKSIIGNLKQIVLHKIYIVYFKWYAPLFFRTLV